MTMTDWTLTEPNKMTDWTLTGQNDRLETCWTRTKRQTGDLLDTNKMTDWTLTGHKQNNRLDNNKMTLDTYCIERLRTLPEEQKRKC